MRVKEESKYHEHTQYVFGQEKLCLSRIRLEQSLRMFCSSKVKQTSNGKISFKAS